MSNSNEVRELKIGPLAEVQNFLDIQRRQHFELHARGIVDTAFAADVLSKDQLGQMNELTIASVQLLQLTDPKGYKETARICFITPDVSRPGSYANPHQAHVGVAYNYPNQEDDITEPINGFSIEEAEVVRRMLEERRMAVYIGLLPHLPASLTFLPENILRLAAANTSEQIPSLMGNQ